MKYFLCLSGLLFVFEGIPYFLAPLKMKDYMRRIICISDEHLRVMGFISMMVGLVLVYIGRRP